jgi:rRNA maturation RNase YbeY
LKIKLFYDGIKFRLRDAGKVRELIELIITDKGKRTGEVSFIFTSGSSLLELNKQFLKHNYFTDVIAFNYNVKEIINGEIYISIDDVKKNSEYYKVNINNEVLRVMVHGVLHLCGFADSTEKQISEMRAEEGRWLSYYEKLKNGI